jgi:hypothetical protein
MPLRNPIGNILDLYGNRQYIRNKIFALVSLTQVIGIGKMILPLLITAINYTGVQGKSGKGLNLSPVSTTPVIIFSPGVVYTC